jgi:hypothetical protein
MHKFHVHPLSGDDARSAYPLIREVEPELDLDSWLAFVRRVTRPGADRMGIIVATRAGQRFPSGLFCYRCHDDLALGTVVTADYFVAVDILDPTPVVGAMVSELEVLGERLKCDAVCSIVHNRAETFGHCLRTSGHQMKAKRFVKRLALEATRH